MCCHHYHLIVVQESYNSLGFSTIPEVQRSNMAAVILQLKALGIDNVLRFPFVSPPPAQSMARALEYLFALGALDAACKLTEPLGKPWYIMHISYANVLFKGCNWPSFRLSRVRHSCCWRLVAMDAATKC